MNIAAFHIKQWKTLNPQFDPLKKLNSRPVTEVDKPREKLAEVGAENMKVKEIIKKAKYSQTPLTLGAHPP